MECGNEGEKLEKSQISVPVWKQCLLRPIVGPAVTHGSVHISIPRYQSADTVKLVQNWH